MLPKAQLMRLTKDTRSANTRVADHAHNYYEFVYYIKAEGQLTAGERQHRIRSGRFTVMKPGTVHGERHDIDAVVFFFVFESEQPLEYGVWDDDPERSIGRICDAMAEEYYSRRPFGDELISLLLSELLLRILRMRTSGGVPRHDIEYAAEFIEKNFREKIDLSALAADVGYGYDHFHHLFSARYGVSPKQYQMRFRMENAKRLLSLGRYSCTEVAYLSGFSDSAQFSTLFKRAAGMTPAAYMRQNQRSV